MRFLLFHLLARICFADSLILSSGVNGFYNHGKHLAESDYHKTLKYTDGFLSTIGWSEIK
ncbi:MAG: hypothetical protein ACJZ9B_05255 [Coraliomargaritaceae bacterium]